MLVAYIEDDVHQAELVKAWLENDDFEVDLFHTGRSFVNRFMKRSYEMVLIDWELPDIEGLALLGWLRATIRSKVPVLFLTARESNRHIAQALDTGADDYLVKPIDRMVLMARARAVIRRYSGRQQRRPTGTAGEYEFDRRSETIKRRGEVVDLTRREFLLAACLIENVETIVTREKIMTEVWGLSADVPTRTVDTHASRLRKRLGWVKENGWQLSSVYQQGYRLERVQD